MKVDIILPVYQPKRWVFDAVDSIKSQTYRHWNLIIVDDHTPASREVMRKMRKKAQSHPKIKFIRLEKNSKPAGARNRALAQGKGEFIAFIDQDDKWHSRKLEKCMGYLKSHPQIDLVHSDIEAMDEKGEVNKNQFDKENKKRAEIPYSRLQSKELMRELARFYSLRFGTIVVRRSALEAMGGFDESFFGGEEFVFTLRFAARYRMVHLAEKLTFRRLHQGNLSKNRNRIIGELNAYKKMRLEFPLLETLLKKKQRRALQEAIKVKLINREKKEAVRYSQELIRLAPLSFSVYCFYLMSVICFTPKCVRWIEFIKKKIHV